MKRSKLLLVAGIIGAAYLVYLISYFSGANASAGGAEAVGTGIATIIVVPHMVCVGIAWFSIGLDGH